MSRKVIIEIKAKVTVLVNDDVTDMGLLDLQMYNDNHHGDVEDFELIDTEVVDSK
jgi:hypothetical protein